MLSDMSMKFPHTILCALGFLLVLGCSDKAKDLFETAVFEENQNNVPHARELYEELIRAHPSSKLAELAKARLADLKER
jgi:TolA-binding protein